MTDQQRLRAVESLTSIQGDASRASGRVRCGVIMLRYGRHRDAMGGISFVESL